MNEPSALAAHALLPAARQRGDLVRFALLVAVVIAAYWPALQAQFIWNDSDYVTAPPLRSAQGLARIWFEVGATEQYYPVLHSAFWVQHRLWGDTPLGYHLVNVLAHAASAGLLALVLRRLAIPGAWLAAFVFAVHPIYVESVAWIAEQKNTLSTVLYLLAGLAYLRFSSRKSTGLYLVAFGLFCVALLTKSVAATLPGALLVVAWWRHGRLELRRDVVPLLPWFAAGAAMGLFSMWVERHHIGAEGEEFDLSLVERLLVAGRTPWFYLGKIVWPANLTFIYPRWNVDAAAGWQYLFPAATALALGLLWRLRRRTRAPLAAFLFFGGSLFPVLGFFNVFAFIYSFVADHWQYVPSIGIIVLGCAAFASFTQRCAPQTRRVAAALLIGALAVHTRGQCRMYSDVTTLYRATLARNPECWMAHNNLGVLLAETPGRLSEAIAHYEAALALKPDHVGAHKNLGNALNRIPGREAEALAHYEAALRIQPDRFEPEIHFNLANTLARFPDRRAQAIHHYQRALALNPRLAEAHLNLAALLAQQPDATAEAIEHLQAALQVNPEYVDAHNNLANALIDVPGRLDEAIVHYQEAIRLNPAHVFAHYNVAVAYSRRGERALAIRHLDAVLALQPAFDAAQRLRTELLNKQD